MYNTYIYIWNPVLLYTCWYRQQVYQNILKNGKNALVVKGVSAAFAISVPPCRKKHHSIC